MYVSAYFSFAGVSENSDFSEDSSVNVSEDYGSLDESFSQTDMPKGMKIENITNNLISFEIKASLFHLAILNVQFCEQYFTCPVNK